MLFIVLSFALVSCGSVEKSDYVAANESLLAEFPVFSGAKELTLTPQSSGYNVDGKTMFATTDGYITTVEYMVPLATTNEAVVAFFLDGVDSSWKRVLIGSGARFCRGESAVTVITSGVEETGRPSYAVYADHRYNQNPSSQRC